MPENFAPYDPVELLSSREAVEVFVTNALASGDAAYVAAALGVAARVLDQIEPAISAGLPRESLNGSANGQSDLSLKAALAVLDALGMQVAVTMRRIDSGSPSPHPAI